MAEAVLELASRPDGLSVRLLAAGADQPVAQARVPRTMLDQGRADLTWGEDGEPLTVASLVAKPMANLNARTAWTIGRFLYGLAFPQAVADAWRARKAAGKGLTTLLEVLPPDGGAPDLRNLPWELLLDTANDEALFLFCDQDNPMGLKIPALGPMPAPLCWPLRMLILVGTTTDPEIAWEDELLAIRRALLTFSLCIDLRIRKAPLSKKDATQAIEDVRPHLLHFIGHGFAPRAGEPEGGLLLDDGAGNREWKRSEIRTALTALKPPPRIVVINACEATGPGTGAVAAAFARVDCPAVIAMRGKIPGRAAACFSGAFYRTLAQKGVNRPDLAYARALGAVSQESSSGAESWFLPRMFFQHGVTGVFPGLGDGRGFEPRAKQFPDLAMLKPFVNREEQRDRLYHTADCWLGTNPPRRRVLLVEGEPGVGKSWLLKCLVFVAKVRGMQTVYWDFVPGGSGTRENLELGVDPTVVSPGAIWDQPGVLQLSLATGAKAR